MTAIKRGPGMTASPPSPKNKTSAINNTPPIDKLLPLLDRVKQTAPDRWIACCPAHEDKSPSLSIREIDDGRILLHDFAGCDAEAILTTVGLTFSDLFPQPLGQFKPVHSRIPARDLLALLDHEALTVGMIAADMLEKKTIDQEDWDRLATAVRRIGKVRDYACS